MPWNNKYQSIVTYFLYSYFHLRILNHFTTICYLRTVFTASLKLRSCEIRKNFKCYSHFCCFFIFYIVISELVELSQTFGIICYLTQKDTSSPDCLQAPMQPMVCSFAVQPPSWAAPAYAFLLTVRAYSLKQEVAWNCSIFFLYFREPKWVSYFLKSYSALHASKNAVFSNIYAGRGRGQRSLILNPLLATLLN